MPVLGLQVKKKKASRAKARSAPDDDAKAFLEQMAKKKQASPDSCMFC